MAGAVAPQTLAKLLANLLESRRWSDSSYVQVNALRDTENKVVMLKTVAVTYFQLIKHAIAVVQEAVDTNQNATPMLNSTEAFAMIAYLRQLLSVRSTDSSAAVFDAFKDVIGRLKHSLGVTAFERDTFDVAVARPVSVFVVDTADRLTRVNDQFKKLMQTVDTRGGSAGTLHSNVYPNTVVVRPDAGKAVAMGAFGVRTAYASLAVVGTGYRNMMANWDLTAGPSPAQHPMQALQVALNALSQFDLNAELTTKLQTAATAQNRTNSVTVDILERLLGTAARLSQTALIGQIGAIPALERLPELSKDMAPELLSPLTKMRDVAQQLTARMLRVEDWRPGTLVTVNADELQLLHANVVNYHNYAVEAEAYRLNADTVINAYKVVIGEFYQAFNQLLPRFNDAVGTVDDVFAMVSTVFAHKDSDKVAAMAALVAARDLEYLRLKGEIDRAKDQTNNTLLENKRLADQAEAVKKNAVRDITQAVHTESVAGTAAVTVATDRVARLTDELKEVRRQADKAEKAAASRIKSLEDRLEASRIENNRSSATDESERVKAAKAETLATKRSAEKAELAAKAAAKEAEKAAQQVRSKLEEALTKAEAAMLNSTMDQARVEQQKLAADSRAELLHSQLQAQTAALAQARVRMSDIEKQNERLRNNSTYKAALSQVAQLELELTQRTTQLTEQQQYGVTLLERADALQVALDTNTQLLTDLTTLLNSSYDRVRTAAELLLGHPVDGVAPGDRGGPRPDSIPGSRGEEDDSADDFDGFSDDDDFSDPGHGVARMDRSDGSLRSGARRAIGEPSSGDRESVADFEDASSQGGRGTVMDTGDTGRDRVEPGSRVPIVGDMVDLLMAGVTAFNLARANMVREVNSITTYINGTEESDVQPTEYDVAIAALRRALDRERRYERTELKANQRATKAKNRLVMQRTRELKTAKRDQAKTLALLARARRTAAAQVVEFKSKILALDNIVAEQTEQLAKLGDSLALRTHELEQAQTSRDGAREVQQTLLSSMSQYNEAEAEVRRTNDELTAEMTVLRDQVETLTRDLAIARRDLEQCRKDKEIQEALVAETADRLVQRGIDVEIEAFGKAADAEQIERLSKLNESLLARNIELNKQLIDAADVQKLLDELQSSGDQVQVTLSKNTDRTNRSLVEAREKLSAAEGRVVELSGELRQSRAELKKIEDYVTSDGMRQIVMFMNEHNIDKNALAAELNDLVRRRDILQSLEKQLGRVITLDTKVARPKRASGSKVSPAELKKARSSKRPASSPADDALLLDDNPAASIVFNGSTAMDLLASVAAVATPLRVTSTAIPPADELVQELADMPSESDL